MLPSKTHESTLEDLEEKYRAEAARCFKQEAEGNIKAARERDKRDWAKGGRKRYDWVRGKTPARYKPSELKMEEC